ncbi:hypothetical protein BY458DRAFT_537682 [Sporodiniella umbellata]|nr:hypothetical protein BY458DRAFT_537682 [Sporodiniella umbellata]
MQPYHIPYSNFMFPPAVRRTYPSEEEAYGVPTSEEFSNVVRDYLSRLSLKKRDKALIDEERYSMIREVLINPKDTSVSTAQFRFWVKKMFNFVGGSQRIICHDGKPVATKEDIYGILVDAHREANHGGRDKTSAIVKCQYSWIPKELIARFVRCCPTCRIRRNGCNFNGNASPASSIHFNYEAIYGTAKSAAAVAVAGSQMYTPLLVGSMESTPSPVHDFQHFFQDFGEQKTSYLNMLDTYKQELLQPSDLLESIMQSWDPKEVLSHQTQETMYDLPPI